MKRIKAISMMLAFVMIFMSCNFVMMFTSNAVDVDSVDAWNSINGSVTEINITQNIDFNGAVIQPLDLNGATVTVNGGGKIISDFTVTGKALFINAGPGSKFNNLGINGAYIADFAAANNSSYGILCDTLSGAEVTNCFAFGTVAVYGTAQGVGGLVGKFDGTMTNCFAVADIKTNGSRVGGLIGEYTGTAEKTITKCYSTGEINNASKPAGGTAVYNYIGGLIGYSPVSCVSNSYTATYIHHPYADTVKAIGCIKDLASDVYFDETISLQRQVDLDTTHRLHPQELENALTNGWTNVSGYYPQLTAMTSAFADASAVSAARVDLAQHSTRPGLNMFNGTGREFTVMSSASQYNYAMLTNSEGVTWRINAGVDEYYFDPVNPDDLVTSSGSMPNGLSGNVMDTHSGKYLFTRTGDVIFTACAGEYKRNIAVQVTTESKNPYIIGGDGSADTPFLISNPQELDFVRLYCINALKAAEYSYKIDTAITLTGSWSPIVGMKGKFDGNSTTLQGLSVTNTNETHDGKQAAGLFANVSDSAEILNLTIKAAKITINGSTPVDYAGILVGDAKNTGITGVSITDPVVTVTTTDSVGSVGVLAGYAKNSTFSSINLTEAALTVTSTLENEAPVKHVGGFVGYSEGGSITNVNVINSKVTALAEYGAGLVGYAKDISEISSVHVSNAQLLNKADTAGVVAGYAEDVEFYQVLASGSVVESDYAGIIAGVARGSTFAEQCTAMGKTTSSNAGGGIFGNASAAVYVKDCYSTSVVMGAGVCGGIIGTGAGYVETSVFTGMLYPCAGGTKAGITGGSGNVDNSYFDKQSTGIFKQDHGVTTSQLTDTTDPLELNGEGETVWMWHTLTNSLFYPQLTVFNTVSDSTDTTEKTLQYASGMSALVITYTDTNNPDYASSVDFTSAKLPLRYITGSNDYEIAIPTKVTSADVPTIGAYKAGSESNNQVSYTVSTKGPAVYQMADTLFKDVRYVLFNVNTLTANYRFEYTDANTQDMTEYNTVMKNRGLSYFNTELGSTYGFILNSTYDSYDDKGSVSISPSSDMINVDLIQPYTYEGYEIELYTDKEETKKITPVTIDGEIWYNVSSLQTVYVKIIINEADLDWGIYHIDCN